MNGKIPDRSRLLHLLNAIENIQNFSTGKTKEDFYNDLMYRFAVEPQLEIIGEAANNISSDLQQLHLETPWEKIISFRNLLAHEYFGLDLELVWGIITQNIPDLKQQIQIILNKTQ
jgi:uncharacterized protein with HEPN domain